MDPTSWSAYSQHFSRLGASMNHHPSQQAPMNDHLALSRQDHMAPYSNTTGPHHFLLAASHQPNHNDPSFNANLFAANYDASLFSPSFPSGNKGHLPSFPQGAAGFFKGSRESDFSDLRSGFSHCSMPGYARNSEGGNMPPGHLFPNSMPPGSWRHSGMMPPSCGPFGVLPHETVLQRSHLVGRSGEKLNPASSKQSRSSHPSSSYMEQDIGRSYRNILSSSGRPTSSYVDSGNASHPSLLASQNDPYFTSVSDNYYNSCSKNDFAAYSSYCSNVQQGVQRGSISPYCYPQSFGNYEANYEKQEGPTTSTNTSANSNYANYVPNSNMNGNPPHLHNGQISRQSVITSNSSNPAMYNTESHPPNHSYNMRETYTYPPGSNHIHNSTNRQPMNNTHHSPINQNMYPPMGTPVPASTPAHVTPPSSIGQAYIPTPLPSSHDSGCSSGTSQSALYHSPSNDGCYSTPGTVHSESDSPAKPDMSQHSSPSMYSVESSNLSINSTMYPDGHHVLSGTEVAIYRGNATSNCIPEVQDSSRGAGKLPIENSASGKQMASEVPMPIDMVKIGRHADGSYDSRKGSVAGQDSSRPECSIRVNPPSPALDCSAKNASERQSKKRKLDDMTGNVSPLNCTYSHLESSEAQAPTNSLKVEKSPGETSPKKEVGSPLPVDLSQVASDPTVKKDSNSCTKKNSSDGMPDLKYEVDKDMELSSKADILKTVEQQDMEIPELSEMEAREVEKEVKHVLPMCRTPPMDELSDESKKLCNTIEDLGFLDGLSSENDVEDSQSKSSFPGKKMKREKGFLQTFLKLFETSNDPLSCKSQKLDVPDDTPKIEGIDDQKESKSFMDEDKDNFDDAPSLDPTLFNCSTLQKEMVVPNPEAPSFSSDEDENSAQGIFDSVAMAIQRLDEDNEDEAKSGCSSKSSRKEMPVLTAEESVADQTNKKEVSLEQDPTDKATVKLSKVVKPRRRRRKKLKQLLVIKVKKVITEKFPVVVEKSVTTAKPKVRKTRTSKEDIEVIKAVQVSRRPLMRKCKEKTVKKKKRGRIAKKNLLNNTKKKSPLEEIPLATDNLSSIVDDVATIEEAELKQDDKSSKPKPTPKILPPKPIESPKPKDPLLEIALSPSKPDKLPEIVPPTASMDPGPPKPKPKKKKPPNMGYRTRRRRRKKSVKSVDSRPEEKLDVIDLAKDDDTIDSHHAESQDDTQKSTSSNGENAWSVETHFKTGDFVVNIDEQEIANPPMWRIESKNVLQLFEPVEGNGKLLYRNTTSYSRWSPSSKHKYQRRTVKIINSDDDTVIVELLTNDDNLSERDSSSSCDYSTHPQRENFEVYLQTLVSHALDPEFIPEIVKENDEYFLSHLKAVEDMTALKKNELRNSDRWSDQLISTVKMYPHITINECNNENTKCDACNGPDSQSAASFRGEVYDPLTLENKTESHSTCDKSFSLCTSCVQTVTLYSRLHHHRHYFFHLGCQKVKEVKKGEEKDSHSILEECLQDSEWMTQMFRDMVETWNACDRYR